MLVDFTLLAVVECFFTDFFVLLVAGVLLVVALAVFDAGAGAGVVCAANETPAMANVMVRPMIVEIVFVIVLFVLWEALVLFASVYIDDVHYEPALNALLITVHPGFGPIRLAFPAVTL